MVVYDVDDFDRINNFEKHDLIGYLEFTLHEVVTAMDQKVKAPLINDSKPAGKSGSITIIGEETNQREVRELLMRPQAILPLHSSLNFFIVFKRMGKDLWKPIYKSEKKNPVKTVYEWQMLNLSTADVASSVDDPFRIEFY